MSVVKAQSGVSIGVKEDMKSDDRKDRAAVVATTDQITPLVTFSDTANTQVTVDSNSLINPMFYGSDPYPDPGLQKVLSRIYPVQSFSWPYSSAVGTKLAQLQFPQALYNATTLNRIQRFRYMRAGVEVSIRLNTTMFNSGMLLVSWLPHYTNSEANFQKFTNIYKMSANNCVTVSANTQDTVTFVIPYVSPSAYYDVNASYDFAAIGRVEIAVLAPLRSGTSTTPTISGTVYARFIDAQMVAPLHTQSGDFVGTESDRMGTFDDQEATHPKSDNEVEVKSKNNAALRILGKVGSLLYFTTQRIIGHVIDRFADYALGAKEAWRDDGNAENLHNELDLPTSVKQVDKVAIVSGSNFSYVEGIDNSNLLGLTPHNKVAKSYKMFSTKCDYDHFNNYKKLPTIVSLFDFDATKTAGQIIARALVTPWLCHSVPVGGGGNVDFYQTHLSNLASFFKFWRGDIKFMIQFVCSKFVSTRVRVEWIPTPNFVQSTVSNVEAGDNVSKVFDINGDTLVNFTIPYLRSRQWLMTGSPESIRNQTANMNQVANGQIRISIVNPVSSAQTISDTTIHCIMWIAGGDSFQVAYPAQLGDHYTISAQSGEVTMPYLDPREIFRKDFDGLIGCRLTSISALEHGDGVESFSELCRRYEYATAVNFSSGNRTHAFPCFSEGITPQRYYRVHNTFLFSRGSRRFKLVFYNLDLTGPSNNIVAFTTIAADAIVDWDGHAPLFIQNTQLNPIAEVQVPFYYSYPLYGHKLLAPDQDPVPYLAVQSFTNVDCKAEVYWAVGDDFKFGWPVAPPTIRYNAP